MSGNLSLGDMTVVGMPPAKLLKAMAVIADTLHPGFDLHSNIVPGKSRESCVLCALTVRDFLRAIGFDAKVRPVAVVMWASRDGKQLHSLGVGSPDDPRQNERDRWVGHLVTVAEGYMIDTTLYPTRRPQWPELTGMAAVPLDQTPARDEIMGLSLLAGIAITDPTDGYEFNIGWLDNPNNRSWRQGGDARDVSRRLPVTERLVERFGHWREEAA